jgi:beta-glucanase (GH16 family)
MLAWSDEFDRQAGYPPDPAYWAACTDGNGGGNQELQYYLPEQASCDGDSNVVLTARRDPGTRSAWYGRSRFASAKIWTKGLIAFRYGQLDVAASIPAGQPGAWPAIWLLGANYDRVGWPACGEIDLLESFGARPSLTSVSSSLHSATDDVTRAFSLPAAGDATGRHVYSLDWRPDSISFAVDGVCWQTIHSGQLASWPFSQPFFLILNLAVGGTMGGAIPTTAPFPYQMAVDYVRVHDSEVFDCPRGSQAE